MQRYFAIDKDLNLRQTDYHHIKNVMRMKDEDIIEVVYNSTVHKCKVYPNKKRIEVVEEEKMTDNLPNVTICFPILKEQKIDYILQKATEVGAKNFILFDSKRSVVKIDKSSSLKKITRWETICKEASEQSFRITIPSILGIFNIKEISKLDYDLKILCTLNEKTKNIKKILQNKTNYDTILIVTGPEGGFDKTEEEILINNGFISASLGNTVLRAETAPVVALSMINYENMR